jgi:phosphoribosylamine-glycine ligase
MNVLIIGNGGREHAGMEGRTIVAGSKGICRTG